MDAEMLTTVTRLREAAKGLRSVGFVQLAEQVEGLAENVAQSQFASKAPRATRMNVMVPRALVASVLALLLIAGSVVLFSETGTAPTAPLLCLAGLAHHPTQWQAQQNDRAIKTGLRGCPEALRMPLS